MQGDGNDLPARSGPSRSTPVVALLWPLVALLVLGAGWERFAETFTAKERGPIRIGSVVTEASANLARTLRELPAPQAPRLLLFGSSQIASVKGVEHRPEVALPYRLHQQLEAAGIADEVIDFSAGGQQVVESMLVLFASADAVEPRVVLVGVSLFSMLRLNVRETLLEGIDVGATRDRLVAHLPDAARPEDVEELLAFSRQASQRLSSRGETLQQRTDRLLAGWLDDRFAAVSNRRVMFNELIDKPVRRDLAAWFKRQLQAARTARTYRIGSAYPVSLLALEAMDDLCRSLGAEFVVVMLPFDGTRPPVPFEPETLTRIRGDLEALADRSGFTLLDESDLLGTDYFGDFRDGSPDNLHFDSRGHQRLAQALARPVGPLLTPPDGARAEGAARAAP
ncbi:MAG: hypothetical protein ACQGVK_13020 [Myxococcota bacterium]